MINVLLPFAFKLPTYLADPNLERNRNGFYRKCAEIAAATVQNEIRPLHCGSYRLLGALFAFSGGARPRQVRSVADSLALDCGLTMMTQLARGIPAGNMALFPSPRHAQAGKRQSTTTRAEKRRRLSQFTFLFPFTYWILVSSDMLNVDFA
jgi:hypothetical protein